MCILCVFVCVRVFLLTQLHWGARLVNCVLAGAKAVLQLGGCSLRRGGRTDGVTRVGGVQQWGGGAGWRGSWRPRGRRVWDFTPHLTTPTSPSSSSTYGTGQTRAPRTTNSKCSPAKERREIHVEIWIVISQNTSYYFGKRTTAFLFWPKTFHIQSVIAEQGLYEALLSCVKVCDHRVWL